MKRVLFASLVLFIVFLAYATVIAAGKGKGGGGQQQKTEKVGQIEKQAKSEAQKPSEGVREDKGQSKEQRDRKRGREEPTAEQKEQQKQKQKQMQEKAAQAKEKSKGKGPETEKLKAGGKEHQQQLKALDDQLAHEQTKHADRVARLERMREAAMAEGDAKTVARIDKLAERERQRFDGRVKNMEEKRGKILELAEGAEGKDIQPAVKEVEGKAEEAAKQEQEAEAEK
jgi:hypothetical protein